MEYYQYVSKESGLVGKVKLAQLTKIPATKAATTPDTPEMLAQFMAAVKQVTGKPAPAY